MLELFVLGVLLVESQDPKEVVFIINKLTKRMIAPIKSVM